MNRSRHFGTVLCALALATGVNAQVRYIDEVFTNAQVTVTSDIDYATNVDFLTSDFSTNPPTINPITLKYDIYQPDQGTDTETERPVMVYIHTGNLLPPVYNSSPCGTKMDSSAVEMCRSMARRGYVAVCIDYRLGWNPLAPTVEQRRGGLLNAVYRAIHDTKMAVRSLKANADANNDYHINPDKIFLCGEGTGGYVALAYATMDEPAEIFIEKFRPDPFDPTVSYIDTNMVGNLDGYGGQLNFYSPNQYPYSADVALVMNMGGSLADTSWQAPGDVPMMSFHTVRDDFAPFNSGIVYVPINPPLEVVDIQGCNVFMPLANSFGNNASFATLPGGDPYTDRARSLYGTTWDVSNGAQTTVASGPGAEGIFPIIRPLRPWFYNEASPWQWWDSTSVAAQSPAPGGGGATCHQASLASNPDMSAAKGRTYIDTVMGYADPRIVCALQLGLCSLVNVNENDPLAVGVSVSPNPSHGPITIDSREAAILSYDLYDVNGHLVKSLRVDNKHITIERDGLVNGTYFVQLQFEKGAVTRKLQLQ